MPCGNDDNAFWNSTYFGTFFDHTYNHCDGCNDFSIGVIGSVVPEPATPVLLTCGMGTLLIVLRRRRAVTQARVSRDCCLASSGNSSVTVSVAKS
jgi:hypothetical protein